MTQAYFLLFLLSDLLLKRLEFGGVKEFRKGNAQPVTQHLDGDDTGVFTFAVEDVFYGRGWNGGLQRECVDGNPLLLAKHQESVADSGIGIHIYLHN